MSLAFLSKFQFCSIFLLSSPLFFPDSSFYILPYFPSSTSHTSLSSHQPSLSFPLTLLLPLSLNFKLSLYFFSPFFDNESIFLLGGIKERKNNVNEFLMRSTEAGGDTVEKYFPPPDWWSEENSNKPNRVIYFLLRKTSATGVYRKHIWQTLRQSVQLQPSVKA